MTNVSAVAVYGGESVINDIYDYIGTNTVGYQSFLHKGIVLNVEDYGGYIEIVSSTFTNNMHYIP